MRNRLVSWCSMIIAGFILVTGISACGFKSDLSRSEPEDESQLFVSDTELDVIPVKTIDERPPFLPSSEEVDGGEIRLDSVTSVAEDGNILVPADTEGTEAEGVPVDLTELSRSIERERNAQ